MSEITIFLSKTLLDGLDVSGLERKVSKALEHEHALSVFVQVSSVVLVKPDVSLVFRDFSTVDFSLLLEIVDTVEDEVAIHFGDAIKGKKFMTTLHCVVTDEFEIEIG